MGRVSTRKKLVGRGGLNKLFCFSFKVEITPLMSFKHLNMLNSASKCLKITLKVIHFQNQKNSQKLKLVEGICHM
jgi:hypothetical protein